MREMQQPPPHDISELDEMRARLASLYQKAEQAWCKFIEEEERKRLN